MDAHGKADCAMRKLVGMSFLLAGVMVMGIVIGEDIGQRGADRWYAAHRPVLQPGAALFAAPTLTSPNPWMMCSDDGKEFWKARIDGDVVSCYEADKP